MIALRILAPPEHKNRVIHLDNDHIIIGRASPSHITFPEIRNLSRRHAEITRSGNQVQIHDMGSRNGTYVNSASIDTKVLKHNDRIILGDLELLVIDEKESYSDLMTETTVFRPDDLTNFGKDISNLDERAAFRLLYKVSSDLLTTNIAGGTFDGTYRLIREILDADRVDIFILNKDGQLEPLPRAIPPTGEKTQHGPSKTLLKKVMKEKVTVLVEDVNQNPGLSVAESIIFSGIVSIIAAPMLVGNRILGVVTADIRNRARYFGKNHLEFISAVANLLAMRLEQDRLNREMIAESQIRQRLAQFYSPAVVEQIVKHPENLRPKEVFASVWFCDIQGFTPFAENHNAVEVEALINTFFEMAIESIFKYGGTLDKYLGDGFLAVFGAPIRQSEHAVNAVRGAMDLHRRLAVYNRSHTRQINVRSGINSGRVIAGAIGAAVRRDYTVLGDAVNIAQRIQQYVARTGQIVLAESAAESVRDMIPLRPVGKHTLKGRKQKLSAWAVDTIWK